MYFKPILRGDGVYLEPVDYKTWYQSIQMLINQCCKYTFTTKCKYIF